VVDAHGQFKATFGRPALSAVQMLAELVRPELPFRKVSVRELIPDEMRDKYDAAVGTL
jgi:hypothetical protein